MPWHSNPTEWIFRLQFSERFREVKEAARLAREKSQDKMELANAALSIAAPQVTLLHFHNNCICFTIKIITRL